MASVPEVLAWEDRAVSKQEMGALAFTLAGLLALMHAIPTLTNVLANAGLCIALGEDLFREVDQTLGWWQVAVMLFSSLLPFVLLVAMGSFLIAYRKRLAARWFFHDNEDDKVQVSTTSAGDIQAYAFAVAGIVLAAWALPELTGIGYEVLYLTRREPAFHAEISAGSWVKIVSLGVQVLLGLLLFVGGRGLSRLWQKLRFAGPSDVQDDDAH